MIKVRGANQNLNVEESNDTSAFVLGAPQYTVFGETDAGYTPEMEYALAA